MDSKKLTVKEINSLPVGKHNDGEGLWLHKKPSGRGQWVLRVFRNGKRREMGLGPYPDVGLADARKAAAQWRAMAKDDLQPKDPINVRRRQKEEAVRNLHLLKHVAADAFESRKAELKGDGKAGRWFSPLELHVLPDLGDTPVADIDQIAIRDCIGKIWHTKAATAQKAMQRLKICIEHGAALGLNVDIQATAKAVALLGRPRHKATNIPALHWKEVPEFYQSLNEGTTTQLALQLLILTGLRSRPIRFCHTDHIDGDILTVPADLMKGRKDDDKDFRVPLCSEALRVIDRATSFSGNGFLFPSVRKGVISDATMSRYMERLKLDARPHGFRSSLRTWLSECTDAPWEVAETCIAHSVGTKTTRSYERTDYLEQRRVLMDRWAAHCMGQSGKLLEIARNG